MATGVWRLLIRKHKKKLFFRVWRGNHLVDVYARIGKCIPVYSQFLPSRILLRMAGKCGKTVSVLSGDLVTWFRFSCIFFRHIVDIYLENLKKYSFPDNLMKSDYEEKQENFGGILGKFQESLRKTIIVEHFYRTSRSVPLRFTQDGVITKLIAS